MIPAKPKPVTLFVAIPVVLTLLLSGCGSSGQPEQSGGSQSGTETSQASGVTSGQMSGGNSGCEPVFSDETPQDISREQLPVREVTISGGSQVVVRAEIADDSGEMAQGLMFRESLGEDCGMLFVYPEEQELSFWMRNTLIPLSIAYIDSEGEIIDLQDMEALDDEPPNYTSAEPARYALEVNVGFFEKNNIEVGDTISVSE